MLLARVFAALNSAGPVSGVGDDAGNEMRSGGGCTTGCCGWMGCLGPGIVGAIASTDSTALVIETFGSGDGCRPPLSRGCVCCRPLGGGGGLDLPDGSRCAMIVVLLAAFC